VAYAHLECGRSSLSTGRFRDRIMFFAKFCSGTAHPQKHKGHQEWASCRGGQTQPQG